MSIEIGHLRDCTPAECYVYQYVATWVMIRKNQNYKRGEVILTVK